ncbi:hypothetical protein AAMO2058_001443500 [Amorphochlora amoebiformis]
MRKNGKKNLRKFEDFTVLKARNRRNFASPKTHKTSGGGGGRVIELRIMGTRDDACHSVLDARRLEVFEHITGEFLDDARRKYKEILTGLSAVKSRKLSLESTDDDIKTTHSQRRKIEKKFQKMAKKAKKSREMLQIINRLEEAIDVVPIRIGAKRVKEQLRWFGAKALDHIEITALIEREARERNRVKELVNLAACDPRFEEFESWAEFVDKVKIGKNGPRKINYQQAKDILRTALEPLAAMVAAKLWPDSKIGLGNDMETRRRNDMETRRSASRSRSPKRSPGRNKRSRHSSRPAKPNPSSPGSNRKFKHSPLLSLSMRRNNKKRNESSWKNNRKSRGSHVSPRPESRKSFDLTVRDAKGQMRSQVEVTTAENVCRPRDLQMAIDHGVEKSEGTRGMYKHTIWREVSVGVRWKKGKVYIDKERYIDYKGDGTYTVYREIAGKEDARLYGRDIVQDDFPHYLSRHKQACRWLDSVTIFTLDDDRSYNLVRNGQGWDVERMDLTGDALHARRERRRLRRGYLASVRKGSELARVGLTLGISHRDHLIASSREAPMLVRSPTYARSPPARVVE